MDKDDEIIRLQKKLESVRALVASFPSRVIPDSWDNVWYDPNEYIGLIMVWLKKLGDALCNGQGGEKVNIPPYLGPGTMPPTDEEWEEHNPKEKPEPDKCFKCGTKMTTKYDDDAGKYFYSCPKCDWWVYCEDAERERGVSRGATPEEGGDRE